MSVDSQKTNDFGITRKFQEDYEGYRGVSTENMYDLPSTKSSLKASFGFGERSPLLNKQGLDSPCPTTYNTTKT